MIIELNSVGSVVDDQTFVVYPKYVNGGYDKDGGINLDECSKEFYRHLDEWDKTVVSQLIEIKNKKKIY